MGEKKIKNKAKLQTFKEAELISIPPVPQFLHSLLCPLPFSMSHPGVSTVLLSILLNHLWISLLLFRLPIRYLCPLQESSNSSWVSLMCLQGLPSPFLRCPSQRLLDRVVRRYAEVVDAGSIFMDHFTDRDKLRLLYTLAVNAHPIILQVLGDPHKLSRLCYHLGISEATHGLNFLPFLLHVLGSQICARTFATSGKCLTALAAREEKGMGVQGWECG